MVTLGILSWNKYSKTKDEPYSPEFYKQRVQIRVWLKVHIMTKTTCTCVLIAKGRRVEQGHCKGYIAIPNIIRYKNGITGRQNDEIINVTVLVRMKVSVSNTLCYIYSSVYIHSQKYQSESDEWFSGWYIILGQWSVKDHSVSFYNTAWFQHEFFIRLLQTISFSFLSLPQYPISVWKLQEKTS